MFDLKIKNRDGVLVVDSREVAVMVEKKHSDLLESIRNYVQIINGSLNFNSNDFFIETSYRNSVGINVPYYLLTKKGCDIVASKTLGKKGILFTAEYATKFEEMGKKTKKYISSIDSLIEKAKRIKEQEDKDDYEWYKKTISEAMKSNKDKKYYLYIAEFEDLIVKIGVSINVKKRLNTLSRQSGRKLKRYYMVEIKENNHFKIECRMHAHFREDRVLGEYFRCNYDEACLYLDENMKSI